MDGDAATQRYKALEDEIQRLEISQRKREQSRGHIRATAKQAEIAGRKTLPAIRPQSVPVSSSPTRAGHRRNPTEEVNRRRDVEDQTDARMQELLDQKMELNKLFSGATTQEYRLQKHIHDKTSELAVLVDQDNINQRRQEMMGRCSHEQQVLADTNMQIAIQSNYTKTLNLMKDRLWLNQCTFQKTMDAYTKTMEAQKAEVTDATKMRENASLKLAKAQERNKKFKTKAAEYMQNLQRQLDGLRYMDNQQRQLEAQVLAAERVRLGSRQRKEDDARANDINSQLREANDRKKQEQLLDQLDVHEDAFRKIQMASGLETDEDIIDAFNNREAYLSDVVRKVDMLRRQLNEAQKRHNKLKAALVNELVEQDATVGGGGGGGGGSGGVAESTSLVMNLWGGSNKGSEVDMSTELLPQQRTRLQRALREQTKLRETIIRFAQAVEGVYGSVAALRDSPSLSFEAFLTDDAGDAGAGHGKHGGGGGGGGKAGSRPGSRPGSSAALSRPGSSRAFGGGSQRSRSNSRASTPRRRAQERERRAGGASGTDQLESILTADHLSMRLSTIDKVASQLASQILLLTPLVVASPAGAPAAQTGPAGAGADGASAGADAVPQVLGPDYEAKVADFMWAQKFAVRNNVRVKSLFSGPPTPDDRRSLFSQEIHTQHDDTSSELLDLDEDDPEGLFDRNSMKKLSFTIPYTCQTCSLSQGPWEW